MSGGYSVTWNELTAPSRGAVRYDRHRASATSEQDARSHAVNLSLRHGHVNVIGPAGHVATYVRGEEWTAPPSDVEPEGPPIDLTVYWPELHRASDGYFAIHMAETTAATEGAARILAVGLSKQHGYATMIGPPGVGPVVTYVHGHEAGVRVVSSEIVDKPEVPS